MKLSNGRYSLEIETFCLNDTLPFENFPDSNLTNPIVIEQRLVFREDEKIIISYDVPLKLTTVKDYRGKIIKMLDVPIWQMYVLKGRTGSVFSIDGTTAPFCIGHLCPEFSGLYSMDGKSLYQSYTNSWNAQKFRNVLDKYEISDSVFSAANTNGMRIDFLGR